MDKVEIKQIDRDAAADIWRDYVAKVGEVIVEKSMRRGDMDDALLVQAFAAHRTTAEAENAGPEIEEIGVCVGCNAFLRVGEVVTPWDDEVGHYNCDDPFSLARQPHLDADLDIPEPMVLLGSPALYIPLTALRPPAANVEGASDAVEAAAYAPPGLQYASVDQSDCWLLRFSDVDCGDQWFGGDDYTPEEARQLAIDAWNRYAPAWSVRLMRTVTLDEVRATQDQP